MQQRLRNYKHAILSFEHNIFNLGMHNPGRYCGFDTLEVDDLNFLKFRLTHANTGITFKDPNNSQVGPIGLFLTPQGDLIMETENLLPLTVDTNNGNSETRYDLVVANHFHTVTAGGSAATYAIIKGPLNNPIKPVLTDPYHQTPIGFIELPAGITDLHEAKYFKFKSPDSGDGEDARLNDVNVFKATQVQKKSEDPITAPTLSHVNGTVTAQLWDLQNDGNVYEVTPSTPQTFDGFRIKDVSLQDGARIYIHCNSNVTFRNTYYFISTYGPKGYKALKINQGMGNVSADAGFGALGVRPAANEIWELEFVLTGDSWYLARIGGAGTQSQFRRGMAIFWHGDITTNFDNTGLGINLMAGWQIANGNNFTKDTRGKQLAISDELPSIGAVDISIGTIGATPAEENYLRGIPFSAAGEKSFIIGQGNLPNYSLPVTDPGHSHNYVGVDTVSTAGGGSSTRRCGDFTKTTNSAFTGISVASGGNDERLYYNPPTFYEVLIEKL